MSNSATVVATLGAGALGLLAFYSYQNMNETDMESNDTGSDNFLKHDQKDQSNMDNNESNESFLQQAKEEVSSHLAKATAWGSFWKDEYTSILEDRDKEEMEDNEDEADTGDVVEKKQVVTAYSQTDNVHPMVKEVSENIVNEVVENVLDGDVKRHHR